MPREKTPAGRANPFDPQSRDAWKAQREMEYTSARFKAAAAQRAANVENSVPRSSFRPQADLPVKFNPIDWTLKPLGGKDGQEIFGHSYMLRCVINDEAHPQNGQEWTEYFDIRIPKPGSEGKWNPGPAHMRALLRCIIPPEELEKEDVTQAEENWPALLDEMCSAGNLEENPLLIQATPKRIPNTYTPTAGKNKGQQQTRYDQWLDNPVDVTDQAALSAAAATEDAGDDVEPEPEPEEAPAPVKTKRRAVATR